MGLCVLLYATQAEMERILYGLDCTVDLDDIGYWTKGTYNDHINGVQKILEQLAKYNLKTNLLKCEWAVEETDFLGYIMTLTLCKSMPNKVEALIKIAAPKN